jgi:hypothetical protein
LDQFFIFSALPDSQQITIERTLIPFIDKDHIDSAIGDWTSSSDQ